MAFQDLALWPKLTTRENIRLILAWLRLSRQKSSHRIHEAFDLCRIALPEKFPVARASSRKLLGGGVPNTANQCFTFGNLVGPALPAVDGQVARIRPAQPALQRITVGRWGAERSHCQ